MLKELYVAERGRGHGTGRRLMERVAAHAVTVGADRVDWTVMSGNAPAGAFYRSLGGRPDAKWENWSLGVGADCRTQGGTGAHDRP